MSSFYDSGSAQQQVLMTVMFVTLIMLMYLCASSFAGRKSSRGRQVRMIVNALLFAVVLFILIVIRAEYISLADGSGGVQYLRIPVLYLWGLVFFAGGYTVFALISEFLRRKKSVDRNSIRESINTLPAGVCYFSENGLIKLCNFQMYRLYRTLTQSELQSANELREAVGECTRTSGIMRVSEDEPVLLFPDGKAWMYSESLIEAGDKSRYIEVIFSDVTELYEKKAEIEKQTKILREISKRIRQLSSNVAAMTREEEILSFKTKLHDRMGAGIVAARQVLLHRLPSDETDEVIRMWKQSVEFIEHDNSEISVSDGGELSELLRDAHAIGVKILVDGSFPVDTAVSEVFLCAVRECLTNCVRHAEGNELYVKCGKEKDGYVLEITNNGKIPESEIVPGGGLTNVIRQTYSCGGKAEIQSFPEFGLKITIPEGRYRV